MTFTIHYWCRNDQRRRGFDVGTAYIETTQWTVGPKITPEMLAGIITDQGGFYTSARKWILASAVTAIEVSDQ
jgi:hypothetical protein